MFFLLINVAHANEKAPLVEELKDEINLKDLTCVFSRKRWKYSSGDKVNGEDLLAPSMNKVQNINPTALCMYDDTCFFTCFDKNNLPYSGNTYATDEMGNVILIRPLKDGLPTDGTIKNYDSTGLLSLELYIKQGELVGYKIIIGGNIGKHFRDEDNYDLWHVQELDINDNVISEIIFNMKENKIVQEINR